MELDKRIIEGKRPLTCFDTEQAKEFFEKFESLTDYCIGTLTAIMDLGDRVFDVDQQCKEFRYCLPCEWVKPEEPEKKYRVLTLNEFLERFKIGDAIYIRFKKDGAERVVVFSEYNIPPHKDEGNNTESVCLNGIERHLKSIVCLGIREYDLTTLFDNYEYFDGKEWLPFGIKED